VNKKKGGDQGASACKTAPWATEAKEAGMVGQVWAWKPSHGLHRCRQMASKLLEREREEGRRMKVGE
jgi:hypothetical protein